MTTDSTVRLRSYVTPAAARAHAQARSEVAQSLAGRAAWLFDHVTRRLDRSGPPYGAAPRLPLWTWQGAGDYADVVHPRDYTPGTFSPAVVGQRVAVAGVYHCRGFARLPPPWIAPLSRAHVRYQLRTTGSGTSTLTVRARNVDTGETTETNQSVSAATVEASPADLWVESSPGLVRFALEFSIDGSRDVEVVSACLYTRAKRSHHLTFPG
jgi:hypothetical protein